MNDSCVRFLHRARPRPRAGSDKLTTAGPGPSLNSSPSSGEATPLGDSTVSPRDERCCRSTHVRGAPSRYRLRRLRLRFPDPRYRNSASVSLFISHPASFPSRVSSVLSIKCFHTEIPARNASTTTFTELRDRISLLYSYTCAIPLFG